MTRGEVGEDSEGKRGKVCQGTCIKDTWTKPKGVVLRVGGGEGWGGRRSRVKMETTVLEQQ